MEAISHKVELMCQEEKLFFQLQKADLLLFCNQHEFNTKKKGAKKRKKHVKLQKYSVA